MLETEQREFRAAVPKDVQLDFVSALDVTKSWDAPETLIAGYDGVILGGSGEFSLHANKDESETERKVAREILARLQPLIAHVLENDVPTLGVCFGHQLIAESRGGMIVSDSDQKKSGSHDVRLTSDGMSDVLFMGFPEQFVAQYGHKDSVTSLPQRATLLAVGDSCKFSALRYGSHVYTVQFHPEMTREDTILRFKNSPGYLPEGMEPEDVVRESHEASKIIACFVERVVA